MTESKSRDCPSHKIVSPNTNAAGENTHNVSHTLLAFRLNKGIPFIKRDVFDSLPKFYRAVAEVAIDAGKLAIQE